MRSSDLVDRLCETATRVRNSGEWGELADTLTGAAAEIERLRFAIRRIAAQDATLSVCEGAVHVQVDGTLTDEERGAIERAAVTIRFLQAYYGQTQTEKDAYALLGLLKRLG